MFTVISCSKERQRPKEELIAQYSSSFPARFTSILMLLKGKSNTNQITKQKTDDKAIHYYERTRISACVTMIITVAVLVLLMIPVWLLYKASVDRTISKTPQIIVLVFGFTMIFSAAVSAFTKAKRHEIVVASAGYVLASTPNSLGPVETKLRMCSLYCSY